MRKAIIFSGVILGLTACLGAFVAGVFPSLNGREKELRAKQDLTAIIGITDFAIWTEARYTRHPSQADWFTPFQDFPSSLEHFPAGSVVAPPYGPEATRDSM